MTETQTYAPHDNRCPTCVIAGEQVSRARRQMGEALTQAGVRKEAAVVALRWLKRAGKLTPKTDDERALMRVLEMELALDPAQRRICHPGAPPYPREVYVEGTATTVLSSLLDALAESEHLIRG